MLVMGLFVIIILQIMVLYILPAIHCTSNATGCPSSEPDICGVEGLPCDAKEVAATEETRPGYVHRAGRIFQNEAELATLEKRRKRFPISTLTRSSACLTSTLSQWNNNHEYICTSCTILVKIA